MGKKEKYREKERRKKFITLPAFRRCEKLACLSEGERLTKGRNG